MGAYHGRHAAINVRIDQMRVLIHQRHGCDFHELEQHIDQLQDEIEELIAYARAGDQAPVRLTITLTTPGRTDPMTDYAPGQPIHATVAPTNREGGAVPDQLTWSTTAGTLTVDDPTTLTATIVNAPLGAGTVSVTDGFGNSVSADFSVLDTTPTALAMTLS